MTYERFLLFTIIVLPLAGCSSGTAQPASNPGQQSKAVSGSQHQQINFEHKIIPGGNVRTILTTNLKELGAKQAELDKIEDGYFNTLHFQLALDVLSEDGWELLEIIPDKYDKSGQSINWGTNTYIFRRPKKPEPD